MEHGWGPIKKVVRLLVESRVASPIRSNIVFRETRAENAIVAHKASYAGVRVFSPRSFSESMTMKPNADTFFILGSGASIGDLTPANFEEISRQRSVGINNWGIHPFVPDIYSLDSVPWVGDGANFRRSLDLLHRGDIIAAQPQILLVRLNNEDEVRQIETLPAELRKSVHYYGRVMPATRRVSNLPEELRKVVGFLESEYPGVVLDSGASVVRMVGIALALGFRNIVFAGVDLNNTNYFWEGPNFSHDGPADSLPVNNQTGDEHETTKTSIRPFSVLDVLRAFSAVISRDFGGQLYVSAPQSALADFLPLYPWGRAPATRDELLTP